MERRKIARTVVIPVRMSPPEAEGLARLTRTLGINRSALIRWLLNREVGRMETTEKGEEK
jgi:hypothetical protein